MESKEEVKGGETSKGALEAKTSKRLLFLSAIIGDPEQAKYLSTLFEAQEIILLYRASRDGWKASDFHRHCNGKGRTLILIKTSRGVVCGGYTTVPWANSLLTSNKYDTQAFLFTLSKKKMAVYRPRKPEKAVTHGTLHGPWFRGNLVLDGRWGPLNAPNQGYCYTGGNYRIPQDADGASVLTGEGSGKQDKGKNFTCAELEVFLLS